MEYSALYSQYGDLCSSELEFKVVIQQLVKTKKVAISTKVDTVVSPSIKAAFHITATLKSLIVYYMGTSFDIVAIQCQFSKSLNHTC